MRTIMLIAAAGALTAAAQEKTLNCNDANNWNKKAHHCEMREQTMAYGGQLNIDGGQNGGVTVKGWSQGNVLVRMRVEAGAPTEGEARSLVQQVRNDFSAGRISSSGPTSGRDQYWSVSYEVFMPQRGNLQAQAHNGGVSVTDLSGVIDLTTQNGGLHLTRVSGKVTGKTTNGGVHVQLAGSRWEGDGLDVTTTNGGVHVAVPSGYSANVDASTVNGAVHSDFAMSVKGEISRNISSPIGGGGAPLHLKTTNGGVHLSKI